MLKKKAFDKAVTGKSARIFLFYRFRKCFIQHKSKGHSVIENHRYLRQVDYSWVLVKEEQIEWHSTVPNFAISGNK